MRYLRVLYIVRCLNSKTQLMNTLTVLIISLCNQSNWNKTIG